MFKFYCALICAAVVLGTSCAKAQTIGTLDTVDHLTTTSGLTYSTLVVQGYHNANDGGGGTFSNQGMSCSFTAQAITSTTTPQITIKSTSNTAGIVIGMTITGDTKGWVTGGTTVKALGSPSVYNQITLSATPTGAGTDTLTFRCDNQGTIIKDQSGNFWFRTATTHSVLEWGAYCNGSNDDTQAIQNAEAIAEQVGDNVAVTPQPTQNGQAGTLSFPAGRTCIADQIYIQQAVSWISSGTKQAWIQQTSNNTLGLGYPIVVAPPTNTANAFIAIGLSIFNDSTCTDPGKTYAPPHR